ncbi:putative liporotein [synthetic Mycoplasma mycoides JCVI-syn1.0]|uniref:MIP family Ig-specific serine endopeptidase n=1 Tax=Mycoplasma mycoides TaxID=2102 RepID=UPI0001793DDA|nr:DUF31 family protein [Mycoplasma mycoides]ADH21810.1 putative liporotein [synthetic Mycoplasma mycoides JCVI-syn1.0]ACU78617.1 putative liporotein [Mycoplasma mycoides subsp. capri str. GM12]ACU79448.1 putative liporotein [Mycoplasma mycoides subsp. capri str. GM12]SRX62713.1 lipoprotein [Mycoplasma mycoides subsp. capri]SRX62965.1 lipoprotein [Mycoplasma mycoides subsp. capri]
MKKSLKYLSSLSLILVPLVTISCTHTNKIKPGFIPTINSSNKKDIIDLNNQLEEFKSILENNPKIDKNLKDKIIKKTKEINSKSISSNKLSNINNILSELKNSSNDFNSDNLLSFLKKVKELLLELEINELVNEIDQHINKITNDKQNNQLIINADSNVEDKFIEGSVYSPANHSYPEFVNKFTTVSAEEIYKELYDRTFSIKFLTKLNNGGSLSNGTGTGWLLDYHKYNNENKYKLFLATNLHVLSEFSNSLTEEQNKEFNYYDPSNNKVIAIGLGKAENVNDFSSKNNKTDFQNKITKYYLSNQDFKSYSLIDYSNSNSELTTAISEPKIVFGAVDFMNRKAVEKYDDAIKQSAEGYYNYKKANLNDDEKIAWEDYFKTKNIPIMVDFAVFEIDVDLSKTDDTLKSWINDAIKGLDNYLERLKNTNNLPNQDKNISNHLQSKDYISALFTKDNNSNNLYNAKDIYIAGYPANNKTTYWMKNNPTEISSDKSDIDWRTSKSNKDIFGFANEFESSISIVPNFGIFDNYWHRVFANFYGYQYNVNFSSLYYGASGSLAYNEFGQMIGIYNGVKSNVEFGDLLQSATIAPFLQSDNIKVGDNVIYAYNLIDGTDKTRYKYQKSSFRENLQKLYPNGFSDNSKSTKLFDNIFN